MKKKTAIILDGGFVWHKTEYFRNRHPKAADIIKFVNSSLAHDEELFRIYYYDCLPPSGKVKNPVSGKDIDLDIRSDYREREALLKQLALKDHVALRLGRIQIKGIGISQGKLNKVIESERKIEAADLSANISQKRVDLMIGLDIAWLSSKRIVDRIILVTGDADFIPTMKFARREGVQVILVRMRHHVKGDLIVHADEDRDVTVPT